MVADGEEDEIGKGALGNYILIKCAGKVTTIRKMSGGCKMRVWVRKGNWESEANAHDPGINAVKARFHRLDLLV